MRITDTHWGLFVDLLQHIEDVTGLAMDLANLESVLHCQSGGMFRSGQSIVATAIADTSFCRRTSSMQLPLAGMAIGVPQNRKGGFNQPTLAVKIMDLRKAPDQFVMPFAYDVFTDGRRVLQVMDGLTLDDDWRNSRHDIVGSLLEELHAIFNVVPEYLPFVVALIKAFDCKGNRRTEEAKQAAISQLHSFNN